jgi:hypothetical protein
MNIHFFFFFFFFVLLSICHLGCLIAMRASLLCCFEGRKGGTLGFILYCYFLHSGAAYIFATAQSGALIADPVVSVRIVFHPIYHCTDI